LLLDAAPAPEVGKRAGEMLGGGDEDAALVERRLGR
jgi:hypothetical protein